MNYRELLDDAQHQLDTYKHPNIDEFTSKFSALFEAAGFGNLNYRSVDQITEHKDTFSVETSWSSRGCSQHGTITLPFSVIDAADPVKAATIWRIQQDLDKAMSEVNNHRKMVSYYEEQVKKLQDKLIAVN